MTAAVGVTVAVLAGPATKPAAGVQVYEVAAGLHVAVSITELPRLIVLAEAVTVHTGTAIPAACVTVKV